MKRFTQFIRIAPILFASAIGLSGCGGGPDSPPADPSPEIQALHEDRIETFRKLVAFAEAQFAAGQAPTTNVLEAKRQLLAAQLDATSEPAERIALRKEILENLRQFEKQVAAQAGNGEASPSNLLEVRAARIQAEIDLAEEGN